MYAIVYPETFQTVFWPKIGPITTDFDGNRGDRFPPMRPRILSGSRGPAGPKIEFLSWGGAHICYSFPSKRMAAASPPRGSHRSSLDWPP